MAKGIFNWNYADVTEFLKENGFVFFEQREGSHEAWTHPQMNAVVVVNFHGNKKSFPPRTFETMVRQSRIDKKVWRAWASR